MIRANSFPKLAICVALAAPSLLSAPSAHADVPVQAKVYGFLNAEVERVWAKGGSTPYEPRWRVTDGNSRLGFSGAIDVNATTKAIWQLEGALNGFEQGGVSDQGATSVIVSRNTFLGLSSDCYGRLLVGNNDSAYRSLVGSGGEMGGNLGLSSIGLDLWNNTSAQLTGGVNSLFSRGEARYQNSVHYFSPELWVPLRSSRAKLAASYSFDEVLGSGRRRDRFSLAGLYKLEGLGVGAALDYQSNTGVNFDNLQQGLGLHTGSELGVATYFYKFVASYAFPSHTYVGAGFERSNYRYQQFVPPSGTNFYATQTTGTLRQSGAMASLAQGIGRVTLMVSAGALFRLDHSLIGAARDYSATQFSFGGKYAFNDNFGAYAYFTSIRNKAAQDVNLGTPVYSNNLGTSQAYLSPGDSPNAIGIGGIARF